VKKLGKRYYQITPKTVSFSLFVRYNECTAVLAEHLLSRRFLFVPDHEKWNDDEAFLIERARHFDLKAVGQLYRLYVEDIYRYVAVRVSDAASAEDITSEVFLRALESLESFEYRGIPFSAWLYRIARDRVVDHYRKMSRQQNTVALDDSLSCAADTPERAALKGLEAGELRAALDCLTEDQRLVVILRFLEHKSLADVARTLGKSEGSIKSLQHRALAALSRILGGERH
jgi:RNA polymerase sigma-70 factor (ECF subfamily)